MAVSLNSIKRTIAYDTRIDYYIDCYKFAGELVLSFNLPVFLPSLNECYCVESSSESFQYELLKGKRRVIVAGTRNWISDLTDKKMIDFPIGKVNIYTSLIIAIEINKEEIPSCIQLFSTEPSELASISEGILQNAIEIALYRYNEKTNGSSFLTPSYFECDRVDIGFYINRIEKRYHQCHFNLFRFPNISSAVIPVETPIDKEAFSKEIHNWRYFFSKASYDFYSKKYVDSIIASAISIESYAWEKVNSFCNDEDEIENYTTYQEEGKRRPLTATQLYKKLINDKRINTEKSKSQIGSLIQKILNPRNDIMHGKKSVAISWAEEAAEINSILRDFFTALNEPIENDAFLEKASHDEDLKYRNFVLKCRNSNFKSPETMKAESETMVADYPFMELPKIQLVKALLQLGKLNEAKEMIDLLFPKLHDPCSAAVDLYNDFVSSNNSAMGIDLFLKIKALDIRAASALALLYLQDYKRLRNNESLLNANGIITMLRSHDVGYPLSDIIAREIALEIGNKEQVVEVSKQIVDKIESDYVMPLYCSQYALESQDYQAAILYFNKFVDRFASSKYIGLKVDFCFISFDISDIQKRSKTLLANCEQAGIEIPNQGELWNRVDKAIHMSRSGYYIVTDINSVDKGEMPLGNLIYKDLPFIPGGHMVYVAPRILS